MAPSLWIDTARADAVVARRARGTGASRGARRAAAVRAKVEASEIPATGFPSLFSSAGAGFAFDAAKVVRALSRKDPALGRAMRLVGPFQMRHSSMHSPFEALATSIVYQQLTGKAAATILSRVVALFKPPFPRPQHLIAAKDETLRSAGLSRNKAAALKDLAEKTLTGVVPGLAELASMEEEAIIERLTSVRGVGRWTVEMLLMFRLGRPDVLPATDFGVRKGFARAQGLATLPSPKELLAHGEKWRPWRTVASWYLWRVTELPDELLPAL
jgi:DNA-3-methyladenine glycosylase II